MVFASSPRDGLGSSPASFPREYSHYTSPNFIESNMKSILGGALMSFLPITNKNGILAGIYLVNAVVAPLTIFYSVSIHFSVLHHKF